MAYTSSYPEDKAEEVKKIIELINAILQLEAEQSGGIREDVEEVKEARSIVEKLKNIEDVRRAIERFIPRLPNFNDIKVNIKVNTSVRLPTITHVKVETLKLITPPPYLPPPPYPRSPSSYGQQPQPPYRPPPPPPPPQRAPPPQGGKGSRAMLYLAVGLVIAVIFAGLLGYELFQYQALQYEYSTLLSSIATFDSYSYNNYIPLNGSELFVIFVPNGYTADVSIYLSSSDYFDVGIAPLSLIYSNSSQALVSLYYWRDVSYLSQTVTLSPGTYVIVVINNPSYNQHGAYATIDITTTLTPTS